MNEGAHKLGSNRQERERKKEDEEEGEKGREKGGEKKSKKQEEGKILFSRWKNSTEIGFNLY